MGQLRPGRASTGPAMSAIALEAEAITEHQQLRDKTIACRIESCP